MRGNPVVDDAVLARLIVEKGSDVVHDGDVKIEKQGRSDQAAEPVGGNEQLDHDVGPAAVRGHAGIGRERDDANLRVQAGRVFRAAMEKKWAPEVARDRAMQDVDVIRAVAGAPFQAQNVNGSGFHK